MNTEQIVSQFIIPEEILWNPIISSGINRHLPRKDRLNCRALIPTWDQLTTRILALSPYSWTRQPQLRGLLQGASQGVEIYPRDFASERGKDITQLLLLISGPDGTGLANVTTMDIMTQPISIEQMIKLIVNCPMPRLRILCLSVAVGNARPLLTGTLKSELKLEEVSIRTFGPLSPPEIILLLQSFGDVGSMSLDDSPLRRYRMPHLSTTYQLPSAWIPAWSFLQIHHGSELLDLFLDETQAVTQLPELTLLTEPGRFLPKRFLTSPSSLPRIVKYRVLKKPRLRIPQFCRACAGVEERRYMPRLYFQSSELVQDGEATVNFVACSLMSVADNCVLHPLSLHDLYVHISPSCKRPSLTLTNAFSSSTTAITRHRTQAPAISAVEDLIKRHCLQIRRLSIRVCKPGNYETETRYALELPFLARERFLSIIEMCGSGITSLEVSAEIIWACCNEVQTRSRLLRLQDKCLNVREVTVMAIYGQDFTQQIRPSAKDISTYLSLFLSPKEVKIISSGIFRDQTIHEVLTSCRHLQRLYIFSHENLKINYDAPFPKHGTLELLFLELNGIYADDGCSRLLNETLSNLFSLRYILLKIGNSKYPSIEILKAFFAVRSKLRWLVVVFNNYGRALLCHANEDSNTGLEIIKVPTFHLGNMIHTYPELYDVFWSEFQRFCKHPLY